MVEKEITGKENDASTIVRNDGGKLRYVCGCVCMHAEVMLGLWAALCKGRLVLNWGEKRLR